jgi:hypothetical protein
MLDMPGNIQNTFYSQVVTQRLPEVCEAIFLEQTAVCERERVA